MKRYEVVGEWVKDASLCPADREGRLDYENEIVTNEEYDGFYWAIIEVDEDGLFLGTVESFRSVKEAWAKYDELTKEMK